MIVYLSVKLIAKIQIIVDSEVYSAGWVEANDEFAQPALALLLILLCHLAENSAFGADLEIYYE